MSVIRVGRTLAEQILAGVRAIKMVDAGFRTTVVTSETGLSEETIRKLIHQRRPGEVLPRGRIKLTDTMLVSPRARYEASLFILSYLAENSLQRNLNIDAVVAAYENMRADVAKAFAAEAELDVSDCWSLARDLRSRALQTRLCDTCDMVYVVGSLLASPEKSCPYCYGYNARTKDTGHTQMKLGFG